MIDIKKQYFKGDIDIQEARKRLFAYASHPDAVESNNEVLRAWESTRPQGRELFLRFYGRSKSA